MDSKSLIDDIDNTEMFSSSHTYTPEMCELYLGLDYGSQFLMILQNIRSIRKNFDEFVVFLTRTKLLPDLIILTECWLDSSFTGVSVDGFDCAYTNRYLNQNDGIVIMSRIGLRIGITEPILLEASALLIQIEHHYSLLAIYRSPSFYNIDNFLSSLEMVLSEMKGHTCFVVGDMNIDIKPTASDPRSDHYLELLSCQGFTPSHQIPTRGLNCLDHVFVKSSFQPSTVVCTNNITDHDAVIVAIAREPNSFCAENRYVSTVNYSRIIIELENRDWSSFYAHTDPEAAASEFIRIISQTVETNSTKKLIRNSKHIRKTWITPGLVKCIKKRDTLQYKSKNKPNNKKLLEKYKKYRNYCNNILQNLKNEYDSNQLKTNIKDNKKLWNCIKNVCNIKPTKTKNTDLLKAANNPTEALNVTNSYFATIGETLAHDILNQIGKTEQELANATSLQNRTANSLFLAPTDHVQITNIMSTLKSNSAPGSDNISNQLLKTCKHILAVPIAFICNLSLETGIFPSSLKNANVCPIHKAGDTEHPSNYRPISLLTTISKILERVVNKQFMSFLERNNVLSSNQYGFRSNRSTEDAVTSLVDFVTDMLDKGQKCIGVFLDLAKAFDTVSRPILLKKLENLGIRGIALEWFRSYLTNRKQRVKVDERYSDYQEVLFGVPQGGVLSPSLFLAYLNDLCQLEVTQAKLFAFADDTAIIFHAASWEGLSVVANDGLRQVVKWLQHNLLTINAAKTKIIAFRMSSRSAPPHPLLISLHTCSVDSQYDCACPKLEIVKNIKYLGIYIDELLSWTKQIESLSNRLRKLLFVFKRLRAVADIQTIKMVYKALCESLIGYCITSWGNACGTNLLRVERAQRAVLKVAHKKPFRYPTDELYKDTKELRVRQFFVMACALRFHKTSLLVANNNLNKHRRTYTWKTHRTRTRTGQKCYSFVGCFLYNKLNKILDVVKDTKRICKNKITQYLLTLNYKNTENLLKIQS